MERISNLISEQTKKRVKSPFKSILSAVNSYRNASVQKSQISAADEEENKYETGMV